MRWRSENGREMECNKQEARRTGDKWLAGENLKTRQLLSNKLSGKLKKQSS